MNSLYYSFDWCIKLTLGAGDTLWNLTNLMLELNCCVLGTGHRKSEEGYLILELVIELPSREVLGKFLKHTDGWMQFTHIRKIDEAQFKKGHLLLVPQGIIEIVTSLRKAAEYNEQLELYGQVLILHE